MSFSRLCAFFRQHALTGTVADGSPVRHLSGEASLKRPSSAESEAQPQAPDTGLKGSPLGVLAPEIRNKIYEYALFEEDGIEFDLHHKVARAPGRALTQTCRVIRNETLRMYYFINPVKLLTHILDLESTWHSNVQRWYSTVSAAQIAEVQSIVINLGHYGRYWKVDAALGVSAPELATLRSQLPAHTTLNLVLLMDNPVQASKPLSLLVAMSRDAVKASMRSFGTQAEDQQPGVFLMQPWVLTVAFDHQRFMLTELLSSLPLAD